MATVEATAEAEKLRLHALNIALAAKTGRDGDLRDAVEYLIDAAARSLDGYGRRIADRTLG